MTKQAFTTVDLLRHGEPVGGRMYRGHRDDPLSPRGWEQMRAATSRLEGWGRLLSSPLRRCAEFAAELSRRHGVSVHTDERLCEMGFGVWQGRTPEELRLADPPGMSAFLDDPMKHWPPGAEPFDTFQARVVSAWRDALETYAGEHLLVVAHGGVIRAVLFHVLGIPADNFFRIQVPYASVTRLQVDATGRHPYLVFHNGLP